MTKGKAESPAQADLGGAPQDGAKGFAEHAEVRRSVTHALADLDLNFSLGAKADGSPLWQIKFVEPDGTDIELFVAPDGEWLRVATAPVPCASEYFGPALRLNARLPMARVAIDDDGGWYVAAEMPWAEASSSRLRRAIATVLKGNAVARETLGAK